MITVNDLTPGSYYTFTVWAVDSEGLGSNTISCADSTGLSDYSFHLEFFIGLFPFSRTYTVFQKNRTPKQVGITSSK